MFSLYVNYFDCSILLASFQSTSSSPNRCRLSISLSIPHFPCVCVCLNFPLVRCCSFRHHTTTPPCRREYSCVMPGFGNLPPVLRAKGSAMIQIMALEPLLLCHDIMRWCSRCNCIQIMTHNRTIGALLCYASWIQCILCVQIFVVSVQLHFPLNIDVYRRACTSIRGSVSARQMMTFKPPID